MVSSTGHSANTIVALRQTPSNGGAQQSLPIASIVDSLEECKRCWVRGRAWRKRVSHVLNCDVRVPNDLAILECLWCGVVCARSIGEGSCC